MSTARDYLAAVQQRADAAIDNVATEIGQALREWSDGCNRRQHSDGDAQMGIAYAAAERALTRTDVPRLVAFALAVLDLADELNEARMEANDLALDGEYDAYTKAWDSILVLADALTPKEDDS